MSINKDNTLEFFGSTLSAPVSIDNVLSDNEKSLNFAQKKEDYLSKKQDREQRKRFALWIFCFMCGYMAVALLIVFLCGFGLMYLSDNVLIVLIGTTLADVIGVFNFVARYLFPQSKGKDK